MGDYVIQISLGLKEVYTSGMSVMRSCAVSGYTNPLVSLKFLVSINKFGESLFQMLS